MPGIPMQRVGTLRHTATVLRDLGLPAPKIAATLGSLAEPLENPDQFVPFAEAAAMLERCAAATGCPHFGLLIGERSDHRDLGLPGALTFVDRYVAALEPVIEGYVHEDKHYVTIAVGCTGGKHRSVVIADALAARLRQKGQHVSVSARDLGKE